MTEEERWRLLESLDEDILLGGVMLSEWTAFMVREADIAFARGANLASILTAVSGVETHLRAEYAAGPSLRLVDLIDRAAIPEDLQQLLHAIRKYRNGWVHIFNPRDDKALQEHNEDIEHELEEMAVLAVKLLRRVVYHDQWL
jgi:hypothetical protein